MVVLPTPSPSVYLFGLLVCDLDLDIVGDLDERLLGPLLLQQHLAQLVNFFLHLQHDKPHDNVSQQHRNMMQPHGNMKLLHGNMKQTHENSNTNSWWYILLYFYPFIIYISYSLMFPISLISVQYFNVNFSKLSVLFHLRCHLFYIAYGKRPKKSFHIQITTQCGYKAGCTAQLRYQGLLDQSTRLTTYKLYCSI